MIRTHTVRLYPTTAQEQRLERYLQAGRYVYNRCLAERIEAYRAKQRTLSRYDQTSTLTQWRAVDERLRLVPVEVARDAIRRLDLAYQGFFRRLKQGKRKAGFPRFKSKRRWRSFAISSPGNCCSQGKIKVSGVGSVRCRNYRNISDVKTLRVVKRADKWFAQLTYDDGKQPPRKLPVLDSVGVDVGLNSFAVYSNGEQVAAPHHYRQLESRLRNANKKLSRTKKGSNRRRRAVTRLQRVHLRIANARSDFTHKLSCDLVNRFDLIAVENLNIAGLARTKLSKSVLDAAWGQFLQRLTYKAESAGSTVVKVDPRGTSQECSCCGKVVKKDLSVRVHECPHCGLIMDRDENAANNILRRALKQLPPVGRKVTRVERPTPGSEVAQTRRTSLKREGQPK